jgi:hypothetical protein
MDLLITQLLKMDSVRRLSSIQRKNKIKKLSKMSNLSLEDRFYLVQCILQESNKILNVKGQTYNVQSSDNPKRDGFCYYNSIEKMYEEDYGYVEGYIVIDYIKLNHSWNVDKDGNHIDFTLDPEGKEYFGVVIPQKKVIEVGERNGDNSFCILPFLDDI